MASFLHSSSSQCWALLCFFWWQLFRILVQGTKETVVYAFEKKIEKSDSLQKHKKTTQYQTLTMKNVQIATFNSTKILEAEIQPLIAKFEEDESLLAEVDKESLSTITDGKKTTKTVWKIVYKSNSDATDTITKRITSDAVQSNKNLKKILTKGFKTSQQTRSQQQQAEETAHQEAVVELSQRLAEVQQPVPQLQAVDASQLSPTAGQSDLGEEMDIDEEEEDIFREHEEEEEEEGKFAKKVAQMQNDIEILQNHANESMQGRLKEQLNANSVKFCPFVEIPENLNPDQFNAYYRSKFKNGEEFRVFSINKKKPSIQQPTIQYSIANFFAKNGIEADIPIHLHENQFHVFLVWFSTFHKIFLQEKFQVNNYVELRASKDAKDTIIMCIKKINRNCRNAQNKQRKAFNDDLNAFLQK